MYRTIDASFWTDAKVRKLGVNDRLLFLYLITNPHTHVSGLYYLPLLIAQHESGIASKPLRYAIDTLSIAGISRYDFENELVWVVRMFKFQGPGPKNTLSAAHHLSRDIHNSFLINEFLETYPEVKEHFKNRVSIGNPVGATPHSPFPIPEQEHRTQNTDSKTAFGQFENVLLTLDENVELDKKFGTAEAATRIEALSEYIASKGKKYSSHYATILSWDRKNGAKANGKESHTERVTRKNRETLERINREMLGPDRSGAKPGSVD